MALDISHHSYRHINTRSEIKAITFGNTLIALANANGNAKNS